MFYPVSTNTTSRSVSFRFDVDKTVAANLRLLRNQFNDLQAASERAQKMTSPQYVSDIKRSHFVDCVLNFKAEGASSFQRIGVEFTDLENPKELSMTQYMPAYGNIVWMVEFIGCYREFKNAGTAILPSWVQVGTYTKVMNPVVTQLYGFKVLTPDEVKAIQAAQAAAVAAANAAQAAAAAAVAANEAPGAAAAAAGGAAAVTTLTKAAAETAKAAVALENEAASKTDNTTGAGFTLAGLDMKQAALLLAVLGGMIYGAVKLMKGGR